MGVDTLDYGYEYQGVATAAVPTPSTLRARHCLLTAAARSKCELIDCLLPSAPPRPALPLLVPSQPRPAQPRQSKPRPPRPSLSSISLNLVRLPCVPFIYVNSYSFSLAITFLSTFCAPMNSIFL